MEITHNEDRNRFELELPGGVAILSYEERNGVMDLQHTLVPVPERGKGMGAHLVKHALDYARENKFRVIPSCWYVRQWIDENEEYEELVA